MNDGFRCGLISGSFLIAGIFLGMTMGMLAAPQSGIRTRRKLKRMIDDVGDRVDDWTEETKEAVGEMVTRGKDVIGRRSSRVG